MRQYLHTVAALSLCGAGTAFAASITYSGTSGTLAASAEFEAIGTNLVVTLTNTSAGDVLTQPNILTSIFFEVSGGSLLGLDSMAGSAVIGAGSSVLFGSAPGGIVGGEWAYLEGIGGQTPNGARYGLSSAGFGIFGSPTFPGADLDPPGAVNGVNYGITSAGDNPATGQSAVTGANPLIQNAVVFTMANLPLNFDPATRITNVWFQYGTALSPTDPGIPGVPEPASAMLLMAGGLLLRRR